MTTQLGFRTSLLIAGSVLAAAGLNLSVLDLRSSDDESGTETIADSTTDQSTDTGSDWVDGEVIDAEAASAKTDELEPLPTPAAGDDAAEDDQPALPSPSTALSQPPAAAAPQPVESTTTAGAKHLSYDVDGIGEVVIEQQPDDTISLVSVSTNPGWVYRVGENVPLKVRIDFHRDGGEEEDDEATFTVKLDTGQLKVEQESDNDD